jgi:hypothetical protein
VTASHRITIITIIMRASSSLFALCMAFAIAFAFAESSIPAQSLGASPISHADIGSSGEIIDPVANPLLTPMPPVDPAAIAKKPKKEYYRKPVDFLGSRTGVPMNPSRHLQKVLEEDKKYIASILRAPLDLGDPDSCTHEDIEKDQMALKRIALRINHRRISLRQQQQWIDSATEGLRKLEQEIKTTTDTATNLAEQLDALNQQREDIANHVRRAMLLKELDQTSANLMRLKNARMAQEVHLQKKHNGFAAQNAKHNRILKKLHHMRTVGKLPLGYLDDPKPYRFQQVDAESKAEANVEATAAAEATATTTTATQAKAESADPAPAATSESESAAADSAPAITAKSASEIDEGQLAMLEHDAEQDLAAHEKAIEEEKQ